MSFMIWEELKISIVSQQPDGLAVAVPCYHECWDQKKECFGIFHVFAYLTVAVHRWVYKFSRVFRNPQINSALLLVELYCKL